MCVCVTCPIACVHGVLQQSPPTTNLIGHTLPKYAMSHRRVGKVNKFAVPETVVFFFVNIFTFILRVFLRIYLKLYNNYCTQRYPY